MQMTALITKANAPLDQWAAAALIEFDRLGLKAPTANECRNAYEVGDSPETFAAYVAGLDLPDEAETDPGEFAMGLAYELNEVKDGWGWQSVVGRDIGEIDILTRAGVRFRMSVTLIANDDDTFATERDD